MDEKFIVNFSRKDLGDSDVVHENYEDMSKSGQNEHSWIQEFQRTEKEMSGGNKKINELKKYIKSR